MPKKIRLILKPTPFRNDKSSITFFGKGYDRDSIINFSIWLYSQYQCDLFTKQQLAKKLDIHRVVIDEWFMGLEAMNLLRYDKDSCYLNNKTLSIHLKEADIRIIPCSSYDPWQDRSWDTSFINAWYPYFIFQYANKYYKTKSIIEVTDDHHPIYVKEKFKRKVYQKNGRPKPPPIKIKEKTNKGETIRAWLSGMYFCSPEQERTEVYRHKPKVQKCVKIRRRTRNT